MKDEKQELLRQIEELRSENGNLHELVGFLTENADLNAEQSGDFGCEYPDGEQYGGEYGGEYSHAENAEQQPPLEQEVEVVTPKWS